MREDEIFPKDELRFNAREALLPPAIRKNVGNDTVPVHDDTAPRIGELFAGYGGLGMGVKAVLGGEVAWVSEIDKGACKVLAHRFPGVPNHGDITTIDWSHVEPVDILTGGFPCQPVSHAGKRLGDDDERWLWDEVARAVCFLQPSLLVLENVRGLLTAGSGRLFGRVLGSLAELGYDAQWCGLRAADVGAPHGRWRVFVTASHPNARHCDWGTATELQGQARPAARLLPTPTSRDHKGRNQRDDETCLTGALLPTPRATDGPKGGPNQAGSSGDLMLPSAVQTGRFGDYAAAIHRWEQTLGRPAPAPTQTSSKGNPQLAPAFVEWMMGLPAGWVTDVPGVTRNEALKLCGNGVLPLQAETAVRILLSRMAVAA